MSVLVPFSSFGYLSVVVLPRRMEAFILLRVCVCVPVLLTCPRTFASCLREGGAHFVVVFCCSADLLFFRFSWKGAPLLLFFFLLVVVAVALLPFVSRRTLLLLLFSTFVGQRFLGFCVGVMANGAFTRCEGWV